MLKQLHNFILVVVLGCVGVAAQQAAPKVTMPGPQKHFPTVGRAPQNSNPEAALTNASVIAMVQRREPETAVISRIKSGPVNFDLSPTGLFSLRRSRVSQTIISAMQAAESARPTGSVAPLKTANPFGATSVNTTRARAAVKQVLRIKLRAPMNGPKITSPRVRAQDATIIAVLQKQKQAADAEAAQMKLGLRTTFPGTLQRTATHGSIGPEKTMSGSTAGSSRFATMSPMRTMALTCAQNPAMRILKVSGGTTPATFTTDPNYNFYTIIGCSFGTQGPNSKVALENQNYTFGTQLVVGGWEDNAITVRMDPTLRGYLDQSNLTLIVVRNDGKQARQTGYRFYAAREKVLLRQIPRQHFQLYRFGLNPTLISDWKYLLTSPSLSSVVPNFPRMSAEVAWFSSNVSDTNLSGGSDIYDFSKMAPGFVLDSAYLQWSDLDCGNYQFLTVGKFAIDWYGNTGIRVNWQGQYCKPVGCGGAFQPDCFAQGLPNYGETMTNYGINVWVNGPRGVDPWTGKYASR